MWYSLLARLPAASPRSAHAWLSRPASHTLMSEPVSEAGQLLALGIVLARHGTGLHVSAGGVKR